MASHFDVWASSRLKYRAPEQHDEDGVFSELGQDAEALIASGPLVPTPQGSSAAKSHREFLESCLLGVIICKSPEDSKGAKDPKSVGEAIGFVTIMGSGSGRTHHGRAVIGISLLAQHRGQGYGSEAIQWALCWGFNFARLHRIGISAVEWNESARKLYVKLGFVPEALKRDYEWKYGRWWSLWEGAMLEDEWREKYEPKIEYASYIPGKG